MVPPPGRLGSVVTLPVHVRMVPEAMEAVDALAAELSQQSDGAAFRRAEALRMAAMEWRKARQAGGCEVPIHEPVDLRPKQMRSMPFRTWKEIQAGRVV